MQAPIDSSAFAGFKNRAALGKMEHTFLNELLPSDHAHIVPAIYKELDKTISPELLDYLNSEESITKKVLQNFLRDF